jgi:hypothetical protein
MAKYLELLICMQIIAKFKLVRKNLPTKKNNKNKNKQANKQTNKKLKSFALKFLFVSFKSGHNHVQPRTTGDLQWAES